MNDSIGEMRRLLDEIIGHLEAGTDPEERKAITKLQRIVAVASTMVLISACVGSPLYRRPRPSLASTTTA